MEEFVRELGNHFCLDDYIIKDSEIIFKISSTESEMKCPYCGELSRKVHSNYQREIQDLPLQNKKSILLVNTRKFICSNPACSKKTFSERLPFADTKGKKTYRLEKSIIYTSTQLSSINASNILRAGGIDVCKSSICTLLKKNAVDCG